MDHNIVDVSGKLDASAPSGGNGGFIETSAAKVAVKDGTIVTTTAPDGKAGTWLIDPHDFNIGAGGDITGAQLSTNLAGSNVTILSSGGANASGNGDINVNQAISWNISNLTLTAARHININAVMDLSGGTTSKLTMNTATANGADAAVAGGTVNVGVNGRVDFGARTGTGLLTINGQGYSVINDVTQLQSVSLTGNYALGGDINASATSGWNGGLGFAPLGNNTNPFKGVFDGLGHKINALTINRPTTLYVGLFGYTDIVGGEIRNVGLVGGSVTGQQYVGALVGYSLNTSIINTYNTGTVTGNSSVGGLTGCNGNLISNSYNTGNVAAPGGTAGGLAGYNVNTSTGVIRDSYNTGNVSGAGC